MHGHMNVKKNEHVCLLFIYIIFTRYMPLWWRYVKQSGEGSQSQPD